MTCSQGDCEYTAVVDGRCWVHRPGRIDDLETIYRTTRVLMRQPPATLPARELGLMAEGLLLATVRANREGETPSASRFLALHNIVVGELIARSVDVDRFIPARED